MRYGRVFACIMLVVSGGFSQQAESAQIVSLSEVNEELLQDLFAGRRDQTMIECREGNYLPLQLNVQGDFLTIAGEKPTILLEIKKTCYLRCVEEHAFLFSLDGSEWYSFTELFTGRVAATLDNGDEGPAASLELILNQR